MNKFKKYKVEAKSVEDFLRRYTNYDNISQEIAPHEDRLKSYQNELNKFGFCYMTKFMSITGRPVTFYPATPEKEAEAALEKMKGECE